MEQLIFINPVGKDANNVYEYEFFFSNDSEGYYDDEWYENTPKFVGITPPEESDLVTKKTLLSQIPFFCAQQNTCFPMNYVKKGIICLAYEDISDYTEYPEPYRIVFQYGEDMVSVVEKLHGRGIHFKEE